MSWKIEHHDTERFIRVTAAGGISTPDAFAQVAEGVELVLRHQLTGALVDYSAVNLEMPIADISRIPDMFEAHGLPRMAKIAVVLPPDPATMGKYTYFDDVATSRGYRVGLFWEPTQALAWLRK